MARKMEQAGAIEQNLGNRADGDGCRAEADRNENDDEQCCA